MQLREKDKKSLLIFFSDLNIPVEVWAYGSRVIGTAHEGSDLDLVIRSQNLKPLPLEIYVEICKKIKNSRIPILVELRDWAKLPESFQRNIEQQHEVLFDNIRYFYPTNQKNILNEPPDKYRSKPDKKVEDK